MSLIQCASCQEKISKEAETCPKCGDPNKAGKSHLGAVAGAIVFVGLLIWMFGGGLDLQASNMMKSIERQVAQDAVKQYNIAQEQGDPIQICVQAGLVSAAYLQAKDQSSYNMWKAIEAADCAQAGLSN
jgi:hypothetical protein